MAIVGLLVFVPGLRAGLASEDFDFYRTAHLADIHQVVKAFVPNDYFWYRPVQELAYWAEAHLFGFDPFAFHAVSLAGHITSSALLYWLARRLGCSPLASFATGIIFITSVHAHEVVWWWADLHYAFGGPLILGTLLAWFGSRRLLAVFLATAALLTDESSILIAPVVMLGEFLLAGGSLTWAQRLVTAIRSAIPLIALLVLYFVFRLGIGGGIWGESVPCHSPSCIAAGIVNYGARLVLRPDRAYGLYEHFKLILATLGVLAGGVIAVVVATRGRYRRVIAFGAGWTTLTVLFFVLALWPYASDRFMYYPDMGIALALGGFAQEAIRAFGDGSRVARLVASLGVVSLLLWVGAGIHMLEVRAGGWIRAGNAATLIVDNVFARVPDAPHGVLLQIDDVPDSVQPVFPPGNTGPYLFRNGLESAVRLRFGRDDISVVWTGHPAHGATTIVIHLRVNADNSVVTVSEP